MALVHRSVQLLLGELGHIGAVAGEDLHPLAPALDPLAHRDTQSPRGIDLLHGLPLTHLAAVAAGHADALAAGEETGNGDIVRLGGGVHGHTQVGRRAHIPDGGDAVGESGLGVGEGQVGHHEVVMYRLGGIAQEMTQVPVHIHQSGQQGTAWVADHFLAGVLLFQQGGLAHPGDAAIAVHQDAAVQIDRAAVTHNDALGTDNHTFSSSLDWPSSATRQQAA